MIITLGVIGGLQTGLVMLTPLVLNVRTPHQEVGIGPS